MKTDRRSIMDNILAYGTIFFLLLFFAAWAIAYLPHYEKKVYQNATPITWEDVEAERKEKEQEGEDNVAVYLDGYPASDMSIQVSTLEELDKEAEDIVCLEVDVKDLEPTGFYKKTVQFSREGSGSSHSSYRRRFTSRGFGGGSQYLDSYIKTLIKRHTAIYSQFYTLTLEDGNKVLVLLNDTVIDIPRSGKLQLPASSWSWLFLQEEEEKMFKELSSKCGIKLNEGNHVMYLDAASSWMSYNKEIEAAHEGRIKLWVCLLIASALGLAAIYGTVFTMNQVTGS